MRLIACLGSGLELGSTRPCERLKMSSWHTGMGFWPNLVNGSLFLLQPTGHLTLMKQLLGGLNEGITAYLSYHLACLISAPIIIYRHVLSLSMNGHPTKIIGPRMSFVTALKALLISFWAFPISKFYSCHVMPQENTLPLIWQSSSYLLHYLVHLSIEVIITLKKILFIIYKYFHCRCLQWLY